MNKESHKAYLLPPPYPHVQVYRSFKLPPNADTTNCEAKLEDGVLKVTLPKRQALTERTVEIK